MPSISLKASKSLVTALKTAARIAKKSGPAPIDSVHVIFAGSDLTIESTNLEIWYRQTMFIPDLKDADLSLILPREVIQAITPGAELCFTATTVAVENVVYHISSSQNGYPVFPILQEATKGIALDKQYFDDFASCATAAYKLMVRPVLSGVVHRDNYIAATDATRLHMAQQPESWDREFIVPAEHAALLMRTFGKTGARLRHDDFWVQYNGNGYLIVVRLVSGAYPDLTRILKMEPRTFAKIGTVADWLSACDKTLLLYKAAKEKGYRSINLYVAADGAILTADTEPEFRAELPIELTGPAIHILCDTKYLRDALAHVGNEAKFSFSSSNQPFLLDSTTYPNHRTALVANLFVRKEE